MVREAPFQARSGAYAQGQEGGREGQGSDICGLLAKNQKAVAENSRLSFLRILPLLSTFSLLFFFIFVVGAWKPDIKTHSQLRKHSARGFSLWATDVRAHTGVQTAE